MFVSVRSRRTAALLTTGLLLTLASCGGGGGGGSDEPDPDPTGPPAAPVLNATVQMRSVTGGGYEDAHSFTPTQVRLKRGGTVTWSNESGFAHNVTFGAAAGAPPNVDNQLSGSAVRTFDTVGAYAYQCTNHAGMSGTITVVE